MTRGGYTEGSAIKSLRYAHRGIQSLARRPAQPIAGGAAIKMVKVFEDDEVVVTGPWKWDVPEDLDASSLLKVEAWVTGVSSSGTIQVQIRNETTGGTAMLSTPVTIDVGELNSGTAGTAHVVNPAVAEVAWMDELWIDVVNAGSGALGLGVTLYFTPADVASVTVEGARGPAGGVTEFTGQWTTATGYTAGQVVTNDGVAYVATVDHTSGATTEPGTGASWQTVWIPMADVPLTAGIPMTVVSASGAIPTGVKGLCVLPFDATLSEVWLLADAAGNATVDVWRTTYAGYPGSVADSIGGLSLSGAIKNLDTTLVGWDTALSEDDILQFHMSGVTVITRLHVFMKLAK